MLAGSDSQYEPKVKNNLAGISESDRLSLPYRNMETHLLEHGFDGIYDKYMPEQNRARLTKQPGEDGYRAEFADLLPNRSKTRAAAEVAVEMETRGAVGVTQEIRGILEKAVALAGGE